MKRRTFIAGGVGLAVSGGLVLKPTAAGAPHDAYFSALNTLLRENGPGKPVMLIDLDRMNQNIDNIVAWVGPKKTYRIVVKSLPAIGLLQHIMQRANTQALMLFHQPFINVVAEHLPNADVLVGKPMPVRAVETFYLKHTMLKHEIGDMKFNPATQIQWLVDTQKRYQQYRALAKKLGITMRINLELDVGLHRGGFSNPVQVSGLLDDMLEAKSPLSFAGFMGYEAHLSGTEAVLTDASVQQVLSIYNSFKDLTIRKGFDQTTLTFNGAGSHTLAIYKDDDTMNDLSAGSGILKPSDFDTYHLQDNEAALYIATPILKHYASLTLPVNELATKALSLWDPNREQLYYVYGGYWKARYVSPTGIPDAVYHSTNQEPVTTSAAVDLKVDDYMFLRPTQSEHVMLQFGNLLAIDNNKIVTTWPVFNETT